MTTVKKQDELEVGDYIQSRAEDEYYEYVGIKEYIYKGTEYSPREPRKVKSMMVKKKSGLCEYAAVHPDNEFHVLITPPKYKIGEYVLVDKEYDGVVGGVVQIESVQYFDKNKHYLHYSEELREKMCGKFWYNFGRYCEDDIDKLQDPQRLLQYTKHTLNSMQSQIDALTRQVTILNRMN